MFWFEQGGRFFFADSKMKIKGEIWAKNRVWYAKVPENVSSCKFDTYHEAVQFVEE